MNLTPSETARRTNSPPLQGRGRGWGLSANMLAELQNRARTMRNQPTAPEQRLWQALRNGQLLGHKFRRQQVIGQHIADFVCAPVRLVIELDGDTHEAEADRRRDGALGDLGYRVLHVTNLQVMAELDGVLALIAEALCRVESPHPPTPSPEGEGEFSGPPVEGGNA